MTLRKTTNLVIPPELKLPRKELKSGFMYLYNKGYSSLPPSFLNKLWVSTIFPSIAEQPSFGKNRRNLRALVARLVKVIPAGLMKLKKVNDPADPHFVVSIPVFKLFLDPERMGQYLADLVDKIEAPADGSPWNPYAGSKVNEVSGGLVPAAQAILNIKNLDAKARAALSETFLGFRLVPKDVDTLVYLDFKISKPIAEQLTTSYWIEIRNIDLYPLLLQWTTTYFGFTGPAPLSAFPVSKIARTLPSLQNNQIRVNEHSLSIGPDGTAYWLPKELDNTGRYEDLYSQVGDKGDDSFQLVDVTEADSLSIDGDEGHITKLPRNIPVLMDWQNNKYSYTTSTGMLKVQDLARFKIADSSHVVNLLDKPSSIKTLKTIVNMADSSGLSTTPSQYFVAEETQQLIKENPNAAPTLVKSPNMLDYMVDALNFYRMEEGMHPDDPVPWKDFNLGGPVSLRPIARFMQAALPAILDHLDAVNTKYAVSTVSTHLAIVTMVAKYGAENYGDTLLKSNSIREAAQNQGVDPDWEPPAIPLLSDKIGMLPHQKKVRNLLKGSPDFAILPVQAGGGKSVLSITDVLYEIKNATNAPYLILCPPHLVAQYVKEIVFFTNGKLNVVSINSYAIDRNGFPRLTKLLEGAPRNTVVVCDYDVLRYRQDEVCYGTTPIKVYPVIEFLRQFSFGYAMLDESQSVKNDSARTRACMALIADIPKKRLASGTMAHDSPSDLALQIAMLDPTLFGDRKEFNERFGAEVKGDRVIKWKPGAQLEIMRMIKSRIVVAGAMRKEWAALLPKAHEQFHKVELTEAQYNVYQSILTETLDRIREDAKNNKGLAKLLAPVVGAKPDEDAEDAPLADSEDQADTMDEFEDEDLAALLTPYLARLEQFITAPAKDPLGDKLLKGVDRMSPKVAKIVERVKLHLDQNLPGKVLVFTNYVESAEEIFDAFPPELKSQGLLYVASQKVEIGAAFERDPQKKWMVGVEQSMNTGLNLQFVARLVRVETVWNPGTLEQGNSRVNRPELKKTDIRGEIYYDWVVADRTIDITKISRLISKIVAIAKFENTDNVAYESIPDVPVIKMTLDSIESMNSWSENLKEYADAYREYKTVQAEEYAEYREKHGELKLEKLTIAETPKDAKLMGTVPYTPGLEIYGADEMGLVRLDEHLRQNTFEDGEEGEEEDEDKASSSDLVDAIIGQRVHTEFGDGVIKSVMMTNRMVNVSLDSGYLIRVRLSSAFLITRPTTSTKDIRNQLLKSVGELELTAPLDVPAQKFRIDNAAARKALKDQIQKEKEAQKKAKEKLASLSVELTFNISNGFLGITYFENEDNPEAANALQALGFRPTEQFAYALVKTPRQLLQQFNVWKDKGYTLDKAFHGNVSEAFRDLYKLMEKGRLKSRNVDFNFSTKNELKNFYRMEVKPSTDDKAIKPYPMIEDGQAYIVLPLRGQPASRKAIQVRAPGVRWQMSTPSLVYYGLGLAATGKMIQKIMENGITISNLKEVKSDFKKLRKVSTR
jgi:hypothetical protein